LKTKYTSQSVSNNSRNRLLASSVWWSSPYDGTNPALAARIASHASGQTPAVLSLANCSFGSDNHTPAETDLRLVDHRVLTRRRRPLRLGEFDEPAAVANPA